MSVPHIEAYADIIEMALLDKLDQPIGRGNLVGSVLQQNAYSKRLRESPEMLNRSHRRFELVVTIAFVSHTQMLHQKPEWYLLCNLQCTLDLVHGFDAAGTISRSHIDGRRTGPAPFVIGEQGRMHGVEGNPARAEPLRDLAHMLFTVRV